MARQMKDSGIEWIGEIPETWEVIPHKYVMHKEKSICEHYNGEDIISLTMNGVIVRDLTAGGKMPTTFDGYQYVEPEDMLLCLFDIDVTPRCVGIVRNHGVTSPAYSRFKVHEGYYNAYYDYLLRFIDDEKVFIHLSKNLRSSLTETDFGVIKTLAPSFAEQQRLAAFLDRKCAEIDAVIERTKATIEEYKKLKQAVITEAVTKGVRGPRPMKDSGIEWIGEIPEGWDIRKLKYAATILRGGSPRPIDAYLTDSSDGYNWIKIGDTTKGYKYIDGTKQKITPDGATKSRMVHKGDLLLTNSMSFGEPYILNVDGCIHDGWVAFSDYHGVDIEYLYYFLSSTFCLLQFQKQVDGGVVQNLNIEKIGSTLMMLPIFDEQREIVVYLDEKCAALDTLIAKKTALLTELETYKKSLIYEYVTGKKEVL